MSESPATALTAPSPYAFLPAAPPFQLSSETVVDGRPLPLAQWSKLFGVPGGEDVSPQLSWSGFPAEIRELRHLDVRPAGANRERLLALGGRRHPSRRDIASRRRGLSRCGNAPDGAFAGRRSRAHQYVGAAPPPNSGIHNYHLTVTALDVDRTGLDSNASAAYMGFAIGGHTIARAFIVCPTPAGQLQETQ